ncbi:phospholipase [Serratia rhizosphaerae]|uniref:phospholipase n=1 Tax=Serratia sp. Tan611 TaxID=2773264 RepID=UPI0019319F45|nr:phospholipase [Serratia sp. Tan611]MBU3891872.1 phospholipase [Serratia rubidaea]MCA4823815.1 phospholipase [Serratia rubidaea]CAE1148692.1 putative Phospholipase A(1) [Serratia sp. Tan611]
MRLIFLSFENMSPDDFPRILSPSMAHYELDRDYLFGGAAGMSICSQYRVVRNTQSGIGVTGYKEDTTMKRIVFDDLNHGELVAIGEGGGTWSPSKQVFYVDEEGRLRRYPGSYLPILYPVERVISRYETMVKRYGHRARPTILPPNQNITRKPPLQQAIATAAAAVVATAKAMRPMTKAERWQERQSLIARGNRSIYPDARIAAQRLAQNNVAVEKAKLAENVYKTTNPLVETPGVPEGWKDISNDDIALDKIGLSKDMLYDDEGSPGFLARVYQPDENVFGKAMNPTVVFRGSRAPEFPEGIGNATKNVLLKRDLSGIKNVNDWDNNGSQGLGFYSDYYQKAVNIGKGIKGDVDISGHSLGGGMASAASIASGKSAWTFNAAGLNSGTVEKYGGTAVGSEKNIQAYRVEGELLTKVQEVDLWEDAKSVYFYPQAVVLKEEVSMLAPDAVGVKHTLPGGTGSLLDKHGIDQAINCIESEKDDDIAIIRGRI